MLFQLQSINALLPAGKNSWHIRTGRLDGSLEKLMCNNVCLFFAYYSSFLCSDHVRVNGITWSKFLRWASVPIAFGDGFFKERRLKKRCGSEQNENPQYQKRQQRCRDKKKCFVRGVALVPPLPGKDFGRLLADSRAVRSRKVLVLRSKS